VNEIRRVGSDSLIAFHSTTKGDNGELDWLKMLRDFLPQLESAFVVLVL
jgi:hypothetical protein